jgi:hypothetical protein
MAAELAVDHVKCFGIARVLGADDDPAAVERSMRARFGWQLRLQGIERHGLDLVGARPCLYGEGRMAHLMYRHEGRPVSVFMLPNTVRADQAIEALGHEAVIWPGRTGTFVLIARGPRRTAEQVASVIRATLD